jgi:hypothetical protein
MADQFKLKAFVRVDGTGKVIPGGPIFQAQKPKVGKWREINVKECCNYVPTTTTTTTAGAPTAFERSYYYNTFNACNSTTDGSITFYSTSSTLSAGITVFTDLSLTTPVTEGWVILNQPQPMQFVKYLVGVGGLLSLLDCSATTTTTTTTSGGPTTTTTTTSAVFNQTAIINNDPNFICAGGDELNLYYSGSLGNGTALFRDAGLTVPYNPDLYGNYVRLYFQANYQVCTMSGNIIQSYTGC